MASDDGCPRNGDKIMPDKPPFPHINCVEGVALSVHWGWIGKLFILAVLSTFGTVAWLSYAQVTTDGHVEQIEMTDQAIKENIVVVDRNMHKLDEQQRIQASQTGLVIKQMNKLLEHEGITERIEAPPVKPSELEEIH